MKTLARLLLALVLLTPACSNNQEQINRLADEVSAERPPGKHEPDYPFKSDGCSLWPDGNWGVCCVKHDLAYWMGGARQERKEADEELKLCVSEKGHPFMAEVMRSGVRLGGVYWLPTPFRWGFGWKYPKSGPPGIPY